MGYVLVTRERLMDFAGKPWPEVEAAANAGERGIGWHHQGYMQTPMDSALLKEERGIAFLYFQNW